MHYSSRFSTISPDVMNFYCSCTPIEPNTLERRNAHFMMLWNRISSYNCPPRQSFRSSRLIANN